jgi:hypothetical protein
MTKTPSNGTTTGIPIMPLVQTFGFSRNLHDTAMNRASRASSVQEWISTYELEISKSFTAPLAVHTVPERSLRAQTRVSKVITRVPVAALWLLVLANLAFATLAIVVAGIAFKAADGDVHQAYLRLGVPGLVAALFEAESESKVVDSESDLFRENEKGQMVRAAVSIDRTATGGVAWVTRRADAQVTSGVQVVAPRYLNTDMSYQPPMLAGLGEISRPLLDCERR